MKCWRKVCCCLILWRTIYHMFYNRTTLDSIESLADHESSCGKKFSLIISEKVTIMETWMNFDQNCTDSEVTFNFMHLKYSGSISIHLVQNDNFVENRIKQDFTWNPDLCSLYYISKCSDHPPFTEPFNFSCSFLTSLRSFVW